VNEEKEEEEDGEEREFVCDFHRFSSILM